MTKKVSSLFQEKWGDTFSCRPGRHPP